MMAGSCINLHGSAELTAQAAYLPGCKLLEWKRLWASTGAICPGLPKAVFSSSRQRMAKVCPASDGTPETVPSTWAHKELNTIFRGPPAPAGISITDEVDSWLFSEIDLI